MGSSWAGLVDEARLSKISHPYYHHKVGAELIVFEKGQKRVLHLSPSMGGRQDELGCIDGASLSLLPRLSLIFLLLALIWETLYCRLWEEEEEKAT